MYVAKYFPPESKAKMDAMMKQMIAFAQEKGLETVHGQVLEENTTMLQMCSELGFHIADDSEERGMKVVTLELHELPALTAH